METISVILVTNFCTIFGSLFASASIFSDVKTFAPAASYKDIDVKSETTLAKRLSAKTKKRKQALAVLFWVQI